jgi:hypothetical protein
MTKNIQRSLLYLFFILPILSSFGQMAGNWKDIGPIAFPTNASGQINGIGRATQLKFHPSNSQKMYATTATGGLFISTDGGSNWSSTGTDNLPRTNCASICIDYLNDQILYLGTGDPNYYSTYSGIYKSTDGGATWNAANSGIGNRMALDILMSPTDHNVLVAVTNDGIWKTTDGGTTWTVKKSGGAFDQMKFKPGSSTTLYATTHSDFWLSNDMGDTWANIALPGSGLMNGGRLAVTKADPTVVYLTYVGDKVNYLSTPVLKSTNSGQSFTVVRAAQSDNLNGYDKTGGNVYTQDNYNWCMDVDPNNANTIYIGAEVIWKSTDGGVTWTQLNNWWQNVHPDMHQLIFNPYNASQLYSVNDGGIFLSTNGAVNWSAACNGLACTEVYHASQSPIVKGLMDIGAQDNGEINYNTNSWYTNGGGDYAGRHTFDYQDNQDVYHLNDGSRKRLTGAGSAPSFSLPFTDSDNNGGNTLMEVNSLQTNTAFDSYTDVYITTNLSSGPPTWTKISSFNTQVMALASSPADMNILYAVTNDGKIYRSDNALAATPTFTTLTAPGSTNVKASIAPIKSNSSVVYMSCGSKVYRSADKGATWTNVSSGLPSVNVIKIIHDKYSTDESVYVGMATGVYYKNSTMSSWLNFSNGLPTIAYINEIMIFNDGTANSELRVAYYGRGVWGSSLYNNTNSYVTITSPLDGAVVTPGSNLTINASVTAGVGKTISKVEFYSGTNLIGTSTTSPYSVTWNNVPPGQFKLTAKAYETSGTIVTSSIVNINVSPVGSTVFQDCNYGGYSVSLVSGSYTLSQLQALGVNNDDISSVKVMSGFEIILYADDNFQGTTVTLTADNSCLVANSFNDAASSIKIIQLDVSPTVSITAPANNAVFAAPATITITATATDSDGTISKVDFYNGVKFLGSSTTSPYSYNWTNVPAGIYSITAIATDNNNVSTTSSAITVIVDTPPTVSITAPANNATYTAPANVTITATASDADGTITKVQFYNGTTLLGTATTSPYTYSWTNVSPGTYTITAKATDNNGIVTTSTAITITVSGNPTITFGNLTKTYGDPAFNVAATSNSPGAITYSITAGSQYATITSAGQVTIKGAGTVTIQASQAASGGYNSGTATSTLTINKAVLSATADNKTKVYNTANPTLTITYSGFVYGETSSVLTTQPTASTTATQTSSVGSYPITLTGGTASNYTITLVNGTLTINQATPTLTYTGATSGTQGSTITLSATSTSMGAITYSVANGTGSATISGTTLNLTSAGTVTLTISVAATTNYSATSITQTITINPLQNPTITFGNVTKTYGDPVFSVTATSNSPGAITYSITAGSQYATITSGGQVTIKGAGTVTIQASQAASGNYSSGTATSTLTINKAALTATADNKSRVYNTANPALTISYSGFVYGETSSVLATQPSASTTATQTSNVGTYPITLTGGTAANYTITLATGTLTITQATPTLSYTGATSGTQGGTISLSATSNSTGAITYSVANGTGSASVSGTTLNLTGAGTVTLTISVAATTNYAATSITQTITISAPQNPTITFANVTKTYGDPVFNVTASSNSPGTITYSITSGASFATITSGGQVTIKGAGTVTIQASQSASSGYNAGTATATLTINKASLTVTADNQSRVYNSANPALTFTYSGFVNGETSSVLTSQPTASTAATQTSNVGTYPITLTGGSAANYNITLVNGTLTITQVTTTLTYTGATTGVEGTTINLSATSNSPGAISYSVANGTGTATVSGTILNLTSAGTVTLTISVAATINYSASSITKTITIDVPQNPTITFSDITKTYGDAPFTVSANSNSNGSFTYSITAGNQYASITSDGQVTINGAGSVTIQAVQNSTAGYNSGVATATLTINKANLTVSADNQTRVYNTPNPALTITYSGFVKGENVSVLTSQPVISTTAMQSSNIGDYPITVSGGSADNYNLQLMNGTLTITAADPQLTYTGPTSGNQGTSITVSATSISHGVIAYSVTYGTGTASLSGDTLSLTGAGTVTLSISVAASGNYAEANLQQVITINTATGTLASSNMDHAMEVYPNPASASDVVFVKFDNSFNTEGTLILYDMEGCVVQKVAQGVSGANVYTIPVSELPSGMYILKLQTDQGIFIKKITK